MRSNLKAASLLVLGAAVVLIVAGRARVAYRIAESDFEAIGRVGQSPIIHTAPPAHEPVAEVLAVPEPKLLPAPVEIETPPMADWENAGRGTPLAAFLTVLSAAQRGDLAALTDSISIENAPGARVLFRELPASVRQELKSPAGLIALLTTREIPVKPMFSAPQGDPTPDHIEMLQRSADDAELRMRWSAPANGSRKIALQLKRFDDGWKLMVPESAIAYYRDQLLWANLDKIGTN